MKPPPEKTDRFAPAGPFVESQTATSWTQGVTRYQWLVLFVAWLGWVFDSMDATIYALVLHPALEELLRISAGGAISVELVGWYGGIIFSIFLIGWAIGGVLFGIFSGFPIHLPELYPTHIRATGAGFCSMTRAVQLRTSLTALPRRIVLSRLR